jgi:hypothetical protein
MEVRWIFQTDDTHARLIRGVPQGHIDFVLSKGRKVNRFMRPL